MTVVNETPFHCAGCRALRISEHVYWVGVIDWSLRDFHGYSTHRGSTYNAYLIMGEKITLVDTVKAEFREEMLERISSIIDPTKIDYIVSNHAEMDHTGCLPQIIELVKPEKVFVSKTAVRILAEHFRNMTQELTGVNDGETISLGDLSLTFIETKMLHWPESMFTFLVEDGVLFSNDAFGMHLATAALFDDEIPMEILEWEARGYFANILVPYSNLITKLLDKVAQMPIEIKMIAPDHGPIWRSNVETIIGWYQRWSEQKRNNTALIVYDTMWGSTAKMANAIAEGILAGGGSVKVMPMGGSDRSDVASELLDAGALLIGTPTLNNNLFPTIADVLTYLKGLRPQRLLGAAFGSYGWGGEAVNQVKEIMTQMKIEIVGDCRAKFVPDKPALEECYTLGLAVSKAMKTKSEE